MRPDRAQTRERKHSSISDLLQDASSVGMHELLELLHAQRRLKQLHESALAREKWGVRAEQQSIDRDSATVTVILALDQLSHAAVAFGGRDIKCDLRLANECGDVIAQQRPRRVNQLHFGLWHFLQNVG